MEYDAAIFGLAQEDEERAVRCCRMGVRGAACCAPTNWSVNGSSGEDDDEASASGGVSGGCHWDGGMD